MDVWISSLVSNTPADKIFDHLMNNISDFTTAPCHSLVEIRQHRPTKVRGDLFEELCKLWLQSRYPCQVWKLKELPVDQRQILGLPNQDVGIDLVAYFPNRDRYWAIQCKWRDMKSVTRVTWRDLSTFLLLCLRTGPWEKHVVMTNMHSISWKGHKTPKDFSICYQRFAGTTWEEWCKMVKKEPPPPHISLEELTPEEIRARRLAYFSKT